MICPNCGKELPEDKKFKFCIYCGQPLAAEPAVNEMPAPAAETPVVEPETPIDDAPSEAAVCEDTAATAEEQPAEQEASEAEEPEIPAEMPEIPQAPVCEEPEVPDFYVPAAEEPEQPEFIPPYEPQQTVPPYAPVQDPAEVRKAEKAAKKAEKEARRAAQQAARAQENAEGRQSGGQGHAKYIVPIVVLAVLTVTLGVLFALAGVRIHNDNLDIATMENIFQEQEEAIEDGNDIIDMLNQDVSDLTAELSEKDRDLADSEAEIQELEEKLSLKSDELDSMLADIGAKADGYDLICQAAEEHGFGYGSENFRVDSGVIVVSMQDADPAELTLWTTWETGATVYMNYDSKVVTLDFASDEWNDTVGVTVQPNSVGTCVATFTNTENDEAFNVLIIVTE